MENENLDKLNLLDKIINISKKKSKLLLSILFIAFVVICVAIFLDYLKTNKNNKISEKYTQAGIYLSLNDKENSKIFYKEIILSKNKFYSILALNNIIDNNLEENSDEILNLFELVENFNIKKEEKNLIKFKKALYLKKISREKDGNKLLQEIIADDSIWKDAATEIIN